MFLQVLYPILGQISWILSIIGTVLLCYVVIKHVEFRLWFYAGLIYTIAMTIAQIDRLDSIEVTQVYTNILYMGAIILTLIAVGWDYYNTFIINTETAIDYRKIHFAFFQIVTLIIIYVQIIMIMLMIICIFLILRIYIKKKTTSRAILFLMLVSIFISIIADFLKNLGINSSTELFWAMSLIFTTLYVVLSIVVIIEDQIIKFREIEQKNKKEMILTMQKLNDEIKERRHAEIEQIQSEKRYKEAYDRAEIYKDLFAHDINNLLQNILLSTQMIEEDLKNEKILLKIEKLLNIIKEQVFRGSNLAENVQKLSQIKEMILFREQIEIIEILNESTRMIKESFQNKEIVISIKSEKEKVFINANSLIKNIFHNLLINAVK
ncbi:MAG: HAMP domain-containing histidine kinase [Candidatus Lokiarchaeota archaeon]|nr:HAMP domain-containing histidine kinase [Candidatus Lokiarchaeota archaeon]